ncbi:hypothetical protein [Halalkalicoccus salilacus]|uniref:hypothetical protein n=1 Tax=Halalkalicoccus sp. GCM10025704 TaxID=3252662 RepID=UPI0036144785
MSERDDRPLDEEQGRADAPGEEAGTMGNEEPGTQEAAVSAPEKEQPNVKVPAAERTTAPRAPTPCDRSASASWCSSSACWSSSAFRWCWRSR